MDGALVDNLPTDLVRQMGPDVVIAIHLQVAPVTADEIRSLFSVLGQSITVGTANTELRGDGSIRRHGLNTCLQGRTACAIHK